MKRRLCLRCGDIFQSHGPENRRCQKCAAWMQSEDFPYSDGNFLYALMGDDAQTIQAKRLMSAAHAKYLRKARECCH